jgi:predicted dehydrogenase
MWDADVWAPGSSPVFLTAMRAQAEAFARSVRGAPQEGADGQEAVAALEAAERIAAALGQASAEVSAR